MQCQLSGKYFYSSITSIESNDILTFSLLFRGRLSEFDIEDVASYVISTSGEAPLCDGSYHLHQFTHFFSCRDGMEIRELHHLGWMCTLRSNVGLCCGVGSDTEMI